MTNQEKEDLKEILNELSAFANGKDNSEFMIYNWASLSEEQKQSLIRKYELYMNIVDHEYYPTGLFVALNISEGVAEELNKAWVANLSKE